MSAYVPPYRRRQASISDQSESAATEETLTTEASTQRSLQDLVESTPEPPPPPRSLQALNIVQHYLKDTCQKHSTLNESVDRPGELVFILVFPKGHPKWCTESTLYAKTALALLPEYHARKGTAVEGSTEQAKDETGEEGGIDEARQAMEGLGFGADKEIVTPADGPDTERPANEVDGALTSRHPLTKMVLPTFWTLPKTGISMTRPASPQRTRSFRSTSCSDIPPSEWSPGPHPPIAVFSAEQRDSNFHFIGWHSVSHVALLLPDSVATGEIMAEKWSGNKQDVARRREVWIRDMGLEWAAIKLARVDDQESCGPEPVIEMTGGGDVSGRGTQRRGGFFGGRGWGTRGRPRRGYRGRGGQSLRYGSGRRGRGGRAEGSEDRPAVEAERPASHGVMPRTAAMEDGRVLGGCRAQALPRSTN